MYQALYRKWRPKTFDDVVGQEHITETLKTQVMTGRLSHAYLFIGTRGTGKTSCAKILSKAINCHSPVNGNPCNRCSACLGIDDGSVVDVVEIDAASNNGVDNVRALRDEAIFSPAMVSKRVYIIDEVHMLSLSAFNALLKILEEPPAHLMFILATTELHKVPATILSRCQRHSFKRLDIPSLSSRLSYVAAQENLALSPDAAALIARLSEGGMRDALSLLDQCSGRERIDVDTVYTALGLVGKQNTIALFRSLAQHDSAQALALFQENWQAGKDPATLLTELSSLMRDLLMRKVAGSGSAELISGSYDDATLSELSELFSAGALINAIQSIQDTLAGTRNGQAKTLCELCLISLAEPQLNDGVPQLRERISRLEQALHSGAFLPASIPAEKPTAAKIAPTSPVSPAIKGDDPRTRDFRDPPPARVSTPVEEVPFDLPAGKAVPPAVPQTPAAIEPPAAPSVGSQGGEWERICAALAGKLPAGIYAMLSDPANVSGLLTDDLLTLEVDGPFAMNNINRPDVLARIGEMASSLCGRNIRVQAMPSGSKSTPPAVRPAAVPTKNNPVDNKLDDLGKFGIVSYK